MLESWGMKPTIAESGASALATLESAAGRDAGFDLVLLDVRMPFMDGFQVAERIKDHPACAGVAILMLTSAVVPGDRERAEKAGAAAWLTKPVTSSELLDTILKILSTHVKEGFDRTEDTEAAALEPSGPGLTVLLAEDNEINRLVAERMLDKLGNSVTSVATGTEVLEALRRERFDVVFMDVQMPEMDGFEATAIIREEERGTRRHIPIIAMTAHALKGDAERFVAAGMDGYLPKPVRQQDLTDSIAKVVSVESRGSQAVEAEEPDGNGDAPVDESALLDLMGDNNTLIAEVAALYITNYSRRIDVLKEALEIDDAHAVRLAAHAVKGAVSNIEAPRATDLARRLEKMSSEGLLEGPGLLVDELSREMDAIALFFRQKGWA